jgi:hypothetical protein
MRRAFIALGFVSATALLSFGSTITGFSDAPGTTFTAAFGGNEKGRDLTNATISVLYSTSTTDSCTFGSNGCSGTDFSFAFGKSNANLKNTTWNVTNNQTAASGIYVVQLTINLLPSNTAADDGSIATASGGTTAATASVVYENGVHTTGQVVPPYPAWTEFVLNFSTGAGATFVGGGETFAFDGNAVGLDPPTADTPESPTLGMVGFALIGLSFRRKQSKRSRADAE